MNLHDLTGNSYELKDDSGTVYVMGVLNQMAEPGMLEVWFCDWDGNSRAKQINVSELNLH